MAQDRSERTETETRAETLRCDWRTQDARCFLTATGPRGGRRYCEWHLFCLTSTVRADDWTEFARFQGSASAYCCELAHWPIDLLWKAAQGLQDLRTGDRRPCNLAWCRHHMLPVTFPIPPGKRAGKPPDDAPF